MGDTIFSIPETLISVAAQYSQKALDVLALQSTLDANAQTLRDSLPNVSSRYAIDSFWADWSAAILNMVAACEAIGNLLVKAAITYLRTDATVAKAFRGDQAEQDKIKSEIDQSNQQLDQFKQQYKQEIQTYNTAKDNAKNEEDPAKKEIEAAEEEEAEREWEEAMDNRASL